MLQVKFAVAIIIVAIATRFLHALGGIVCGFPIALCLAWAPGSLRVFVAGILAGIFSAAGVIAFSYWVFSVLPGRESFGLTAMLAATVPLSLPIWEDFKKARTLSHLQAQLPEGAQGEASIMTNAARFSAIGDVVGVMLGFVWFACVYD